MALKNFVFQRVGGGLLKFHNFRAKAGRVGIFLRLSSRKMPKTDVHAVGFDFTGGSARLY